MAVEVILRSGDDRWSAFLRDWILFAPVGVWLAVLVSAVFHVDIWRDQLATGALLTHALALTWAYQDDLDLRAWASGEQVVGRVLAAVLPNLKYLVTLTATTLLAAILIRDAVQTRFPSDADVLDFLGSVDRPSSSVGLALSVTAVALAVVAIRSNADASPTPNQK
jgi:hypothetical protein